MRDRLQKTLIGVLVVCLGLVGGGSLLAGEVAKADLDILGLGLEVDRNPVTTGVDVPSYVQTIFGGKQNDEAPATPGLQAVGELTGPGITTPISLLAIPGRKFAIPALHDKGEYQLSNIRLVDESGAFLQQAMPSFAVISVTDVFKTQLRVRQLTAAELRERGITVDLRNYDVYEYVVIFGVDESFVEIPYPVIVDKRTHTVVPAPRENKYKLPPLTVARPPRFQPPSIDEFELGPGGGGPPGTEAGGGGGAGPRLPAAIILPSGFGVLHQFFAVIVQVSNSSPEEASIRLDEITATIGAPGQMRVAGVKPAVTLGQPVPIYDSVTGNTYLVAGAQGSAEWTLEALKAGTHPVDVTVEATYQKPGQEAFRLRGKASTAIVVSDPRFQINFSHPDTVRVDENYTAYAFVTNLTPQLQHVMLDLTDIPSCASGLVVDHICRLADAPEKVELDMQPGEMIPVPYRLTSKITGHVFAGAGSTNDEALGVSVKLHMGVSESGIPLSPATLVMPYYAKYLPGDFIAANMQLLGLGYSLATAPLNQYTAKFPRVIKNDVFQRAQEIARAGQRIFAVRVDPEVDDANEDRDALVHLSLDLLGNIERVDHLAIAPDLFEWDQLRRQEKSGRRAGAAMARQLERVLLQNGRTPQQFADDYAAATAHRTPFLFAYAHGADVAGHARPYAMSVWGATTEEHLDVPAEATTGWVRLLPYSELTQLDAGGERGELALVGRWSQNVRVVVVPRTSSFTLHLIYPDSANGSQLRSDIQITDASPGHPVAFEVSRGSRTIVVRGANASPQVRDVSQTPLRVLGAAQDMHLNESARLVSILFNRPLRVEDADALRDQIALTVNVPKASYSRTHRNAADPAAPLQIPSAALQQDGRLLNVTFDKALSINASYVIGVEQLVDMVTGGSFAKNDIVPRIDNKAPGGILTGRVLLADNTPVAGAELVLESEGPSQIQVSDDQGRYMYEFVARDIDRGNYGNYKITATANARATSAEGAVRLIGEVHTLNLVFLGRGTAKGQVRYSDGEVVPDADVTIGSVLFSQFRRGKTNAEGRFEIGDLPVGPLTFSVVDPDGRPTFAASSIRTAGEVIEQDLVIERRGFPGTGTVRVTVRRSDTLAVVPGAHVGVYTQGYGLNDGYAGTDGTIEFRDVPAGLISIIAADFGISRESPGIEMEMKADQTVEQTIIIPIPAPGQTGLATVQGLITRDDPSAPGDRTKDVPVPGAILSIGSLPAVTANADGTYTFPDLPLSASEKTMWVFDPATGRKGQFTLPTLSPGINPFPARLSSSSPEGTAKIRVRLTSATGNPVNGYRVFEPGFPPTSFTGKGDGVYELSGVQVPMRMQIAAVPNGTDPVFGDQMAFGSARVDFNGQIGIADLRLPGQGTVITRLELRQPDEACPVAPCYTQAFGKVALGYSVWDDVEQSTMPKTIVLEADQATLLNTFLKVPAQQDVAIYTDRHPAGFAGTTLKLAYEGDLRNVTLRMETIGDVTGRVYAHDRQTPIANAIVELQNDRVVYGKKATASDGTFRFPAVAASLAFRLVAKYVQDGIYRTGYVDGSTPVGGGPVSNLRIVMREQSRVEGRVVDRDGNPVPLAYYWARELAWPNTEYGSVTEPLQADLNGRFIINNVFTGPFRISAKDPTVQEKRGDYQGTIGFEGDTSQLAVEVSIGDAGVGSVAATVVDSLQAFKLMPNTEVTLYNSRGAFDLGTTDEQGVLFFHDVPVGTYTLGAYSKAAGRAGRTAAFNVTADQTASQQIVLDFLGKVAGSVTDPESEPTPNAPLRGMPVQLESGSVATRDSTDSEGKFTILGVPEGTFKLFAYDYDTGRMAFGPPNLFISKVVQEHTDLHLELERTARLTVKAYLPNDAGGEGTLAPMASILVEATDYFREQQGNSLTYPKMINRYGYKITARELGGEERTVIAHGSWAANQYEKEQHLVFPSTGTVEVLVLDGGGQPVRDARVQMNGKTVYTPETGLVTISAVPFGWVGVQVTKGTVGASASGNLQSRSVPLRFTLNLGSSAAIAGIVDAEEGIGQPSAGTRVVINVSSRLSSTVRLETLTDASGAYIFSSIPIGGTSVSMLFYGPDDTTIGAQRTVSIPDGTSGTYPIERVKLDATPPRVLGVVPATNATDVSPSSPVVISFSEPIMASFLNSGYFQIFATDDGAQVNATIQPSLRPDGTYDVKLIPPAPPAGQRFPFKSNVLYRVVVSQGVLDTTGNALRAAFGSSFTTVNYTEPSVVRVTPADTQPLQSNETLRVKFNKAIDLQSIQPGYGGVIKLERLDTRGGAPIETIPIAITLDPVDATMILVAPTGIAIAESAFYRLTVSGIRDTQVPPNVQKDAKIVDFFSYDTKKPIARIVSPVAAGEKLVSQIAYTVAVTIVDENSNDTPSTDVQYVDFFDGGGQWLTRDFSAPFTYDLHAPLTDSGTTVSLRTGATDLSNNQGPQSEPFTWDVVPNAAPANVTIVNTPAAVYPTKAVQSVVSFTDEGVKVTAVLKLTGTALDGNPFETILGSQVVQRASTTAAWPAATFNYSVPLDIRSGTAQIVASVTDLAKTGTGQTPLEIRVDDLKPEVVSYLPKSETRFPYDAQVAVELKVRDAETGIKSVQRDIPGINPALITETHTFDAPTGVHTYRWSFKVPPKNADTRVTIKATATDNRDNVTVAATDLIWERVDDANIPVAEWVTPLDGAVLPSNLTNWQTTLRVRATDDTKVTAVRFESTALAAPVTVTLPKSGTTDIFEQKVALAFPAANAPFVIKAIVSDGDPAHDVELPIAIEQVIADAVVSQSTSVSSVTIGDYSNKTLVVRGQGVRLTVNVPLSIPNLIVLDGAAVSAFEETKLDLTIADRLFVDADSAIDVTDKGYLGGLRTREDGGFTNSSRTGRTVGGTTVGGATNADASHGGIGGFHQGTSNATYGSILDPVDFGAGSGAAPTVNRAGANGGGAVDIRTTALGRVVLAGAIRADGGSAVSGGIWTGAAGGSIRLQTRSLVTGYATRITANGGNEGADAGDELGGGGGRIAVRVAERFDAADVSRVLQARGGRNGAEAGLGGGAGTIFLSRPGATNGELIVSAYDDRYATSTQRVRGTPLAGGLTFDAITIGPRALARFDNAYTVPSAEALKVDATALVVGPAEVPQVTIASTIPAAGADVAQSTSIKAYTTASSTSGLREVRTMLSVQPNDVAAIPAGWPASIANSESTIAIPATATPGQTTLKVVVTDRAGRVAETAPVAFTIVNNAAPAITRFDATPPDQIYANGTIAVDATATDDISVTGLSLASTIGTPVATPATITPAASVSRQFSVAVPKTTAADTPIILTLSATDGFPNRAATTQQKTITVRKDEIAPEAAMLKPSAGQTFDEAAGAKFDLEVAALDHEVAVQSVTATFEGQTYTLNAVPNRANVFAVNAIPLPSVDGVDPVAKTITIKVTDYTPNTTTLTQTIYVRPLVDPNAPKMAWVCSSPNALYPAGLTVPLRVSADGNTTSNGVSKVELTINGNGPFLATETSAGSKTYNYDFAIPADAAPGTIYDVRATALSVSGNEATLLATFTIIGGANVVTYPTSSTIDATDLAFEGKSLVVKSGATLTIAGAHTFDDIVVLSGGKLVQQQVSLFNANAITVDGLYVACGAVVDATGLGFPKRTTNPGAGAPGDAAGGGHMGRGGQWSESLGGTFGSLYRPLEPGGGGQVGDPNYSAGNGGGVIRLAGANVTVDGTIRANGQESATWGSGAGGSVYLTASRLGGGGKLDASGGTWSGATPNARGGGGGGAVAVEYEIAFGTLLDNLTATGGAAAGQGAAGTAYSKAVSAQYGDLRISNGTRSSSLPSGVITELPAFGMATVTAAPASGTAVVDALWLGRWLAGSYLRVTAPDGAIRGTWRIASIENHSSVRTIDGLLAVPAQAFAYDGYLMYSDAGYPAGSSASHVVPVRKVAAGWEYDNGSAFFAFAPAEGDVLFASFSKTATGIRTAQPFSCSVSCAPVEGLPAVAVVRGELLTNATRQIVNGIPYDQPYYALNSFLLGSDFDRRGFVLSGGPATVALEAGADVRAGDSVRGVLRFDHVSVTNARVYTPDLIESTNAAVVDAQSSYVTGNLGAPAIDLSKVTIASGLNGPVLTGSAGAVTDPNGTIELRVRNANRPLPGSAFEPSGSGSIGTRGGLSLHKVQNGNQWGGITTPAIATGYAYLQGRPSQTNKHMDLAIGEFDFGFFSNGTYTVWINGRRISDTPFTPSMLFRIEKTPTTVTFLVDGKVVYQTTCDATPRSFVAASWDDHGQIDSIEYGLDAPARFTGFAASDGSFSIPVSGAPGDPLLISARDRHPYPLQSGEIAAGPIPATIGVQSVTLAQNELTGGRSTTGTVTLRSAATASGAIVSLTSSDAALTVPAAVTILPDASSATFTATSTPVGTARDVTITATYGSVSASAAVRLVPDAVAPALTIESPLSGAQFNEGSTTTIAVQVTAVDQDSGVASVAAVLDAQSYPLTRASSSSNVWTTSIPSPFVEGSTPVAKTITVTATDFNANATSADVSITIKPTTAGGVPTISWVCSSGDAIYPVGYGARLRVNAKAPSTSNALQKVEVRVTSPAGVSTVYAMPRLSGDLFEVILPIPAAADGSVYQVHAVATTASGSDAAVDSTFTVVEGAAEIKSNTTISATDTSYDNRTLVVWDNVILTIGGAHTFGRVSVLPGGSIRHPDSNGATYDRVNITASAVYVGCGASIDASGRGYMGSSNSVGRTWPGTFTGSARGAGGTHGGRGGDHDDYGLSEARTYGSLIDPDTPGASGSGYFYSSCGTCEPGGGIVRITTSGTITIDGSISANGLNTNGAGGGAGGSVRLRAKSIRGMGEIHADGARDGHAAGGGGRVALHYETLELPSTKITAAGNYNGSSDRRKGGSGTVYLRQLDASGVRLTDELIVDNVGVNSGFGAKLADLGTGTLTGIAGAQLTLSAAVPEWIEGSFIEFVSADGTLLADFEIASRTATSVTVRLPQDGTVTVPIGTAYRGAWHIDTIIVRREGILEGETVVSKKIVAGTTSEYAGLKQIRFDDGIITGRVDAKRVDARRLTLTSGTLLQMGQTIDSSSVGRLDVRVAEDLTIDAASSIDASGRGFSGSSSYFGRTWPGSYSGSARGAGATHGGRGGDHDDYGAADTVIYGSFMDPNTPGASGSGYFYSVCSWCEPGGGVLRVAAKTIALAGKIIANGVTNNGAGGGAGGSIRIDVESISGSGEVRADGGPHGHAAGGGGRVAIHSQLFALDPLLVTAAGGYNGSSDRRKGGAGTVYLRKVDPAGLEVADELIVDNLNVAAWYGTSLAALGSGTVVSASGNVLTLSNAVPEWIEGSLVELLDATGDVAATYEIIARTATTITVRVAAGQSLAVLPGTAYRGTWSIDTITVRRRGILEGNGAFATKRINGGTATELLRLPQIRVDEATFTGYFATNEVKARRLTLNNATFMQLGTSGSATDLKRLVIDVSDLLYVDASSRITASGGGFVGSSNYAGKTWPGTFTGSVRGAGGTHGGPGGDHDSYGSATLATYGSLFDPDTPGGSGSGYFYSACTWCEPGGGIIRMKAKTLLLDGRIESNGVLNNGAGGGAGGSIRIDAESINGSGEVHADGARDGHSAGGGGRVAVYYDQLGIDPSRFYSAGGYNGSSDRRKGGAGTVFLKSAAQQYGQLFIDNRGIPAQNPTILPSIGWRVADAAGAASVTTTNAAFLAPNHFRGTRVYIPTTTSINWPIVANSADTLQLDTTASALTIAPGQSYRGLLMFDSIKIRQATVYSADEIVRGTLDVAGGSLTINDGPPDFPAAKRAQIVVESSLAGDAVSGPIGAVTDANSPVKITATNARTAATFTANANADGSFRVTVIGRAGDSFTVGAADSHPVSLTSATIPANGTIVELNTMQALAVQPTPVAGGETAYGTIRLANPARSAGAVVSLESSSAYASVASSLIVPGGASTTQFPILTTAPGAAADVTITATIGASSKAAVLSITPSASALLIDVALDSASVEGGTSVNGTVLLGAPAPAGGALVTLASTSTYAVVPENVVIPEGATQASFTVTTKRVGANSDLQVTAMWGASHAADLRLTPCASLGSVIAPSATTLNTVWVDDAAPAGATTSGDTSFDTTRVAFGTSALHFAPPASTAIRTYAFTGAAALATTPNDRLALWALVNPCNPPRQILVTWSDGTTSHRMSWGESRIDATTSQVYAGAIPTTGEWTRLDVLARALGITTNKNITGLTIRVDGGEVWVDGIGAAACSLAAGVAAPASFPAVDTVWMNDDPPTGVTLGGTWSWDTAQRASGSRSHVEPLANGFHQHYFSGNPNPVPIAPGDVLYAYVLLDPCNPPREIMLQFYDGTDWDDRAYWGEDLIGGSRYRVGPLPETGKWVRLEVPASVLGLNERKVSGLAFTLYDGRAWFDRSGKYSRVNLAYNGKAQARQSTDLTDNDPASRAIDGNVATGHGSMSVTKLQAEQWWEVDLGTVAPMIESIEIRGRTDCCTNQTQDLTVLVSDTAITASTLTAARALSSSGVGVHRNPGTVGSTYTIQVGRSGRYVRIWRGGTDHLSLPEVLVWAPATGARVNVAAGKAAYAPPAQIYQQYYPEYAVNGSASDAWNSAGSIFHHASSTEPYWQVDLGKSEPISTIDVSARTDCCPEQLTGYYVLTSDQPFASTSLATTLADGNVSAWYVGTFVPVRNIQANRTARYVRLQKPGTNVGIVFTEVRVWSQRANTMVFALPTAPQPATTSASNRFDFTTAYRRHSASMAVAFR